jgi:aspartyl protease
MRISGKWLQCKDGVARPVVAARVGSADGSLLEEEFLIDSGADRTVLSAELLTSLGLSAASGGALAGVGGLQNSVVVQTWLEFARGGGGTAIVRGQFAAFTEQSATDMSILGRDVLNNFDLILSRPRNEVLMLAAPHTYRIEPV